MSCLSAGLAKRVGARLLLASTSEVYGGEWVSLRRPGRLRPISGAAGTSECGLHFRKAGLALALQQMGARGSLLRLGRAFLSC